VVCKLVIKPPKDCKALFLDRQKQGHLQSYLSEQLSYTPFVFNAVIGVFIFTKKNQSTETLALWVTHFLEREKLQAERLIDTSADPRFFKRLTMGVLGNEKASALAWKRHLNSFIFQVNPYQQKGSAGIKVFQRIQKTVSKEGSPSQKKYFKQRLKLLRNRVSLSAIESLWKG
jgi:hypothetical protein